MDNYGEIVERLRQAWNRRSMSALGPVPRVRIDWRAYFRDFCEAHGKFPLFYKPLGRLLFPDGWTYAVDHAGPEWPPPESRAERVKLCRLYWKMRKLAVRKELVEAEFLLSQMQELVATRDQEVKQTTTVWDEDAGKMVTTTAPVDVPAMQERVDWLLRDLEKCDLMVVYPLAELNEDNEVVSAA